NKNRPADIIDVESFIGVKSHKAKGKRITTYETAKITFIEPVRFNEEPEETEEPEEIVEAAEEDADTPQVGFLFDEKDM
ncbi:MAG: hypothetical protein RR550_00545, partial [Rikenellaceae bacterium]